MSKELRTAIVVEIIVLAAALIFSVVYFSLNLYDGHRLHTIALVVLWVLVAAILLVVFWGRSLKRVEMIRRFYFNEDWVYNHEIGYAPVSQIVPDRDTYELVTFAADSLAHMSYGFEVADAPQDFKPLFLVTSTEFQVHKPYVEGGDEGGGLDDEPVVVDRWAGSLLRVTDSDDEDDYEVVGTFENARELARLLEPIVLAIEPKLQAKGANDSASGLAGDLASATAEDERAAVAQ